MSLSSKVSTNIKQIQHSKLKNNSFVAGQLVSKKLCRCSSCFVHPVNSCFQGARPWPEKTPDGTILYSCTKPFNRGGFLLQEGCEVVSAVSHLAINGSKKDISHGMNCSSVQRCVNGQVVRRKSEKNAAFILNWISWWATVATLWCFC